MKRNVFSIIEEQHSINVIIWIGLRDPILNQTYCGTNKSDRNIEDINFQWQFCLLFLSWNVYTNKKTVAIEVGFKSEEILKYPRQP